MSEFNLEQRINAAGTRHIPTEGDDVIMVSRSQLKQLLRDVLEEVKPSVTLKENCQDCVGGHVRISTSGALCDYCDRAMRFAGASHAGVVLRSCAEHRWAIEERMAELERGA